MTGLAVIDEPGVPSAWDASWRLAQRIARTEFVPTALRGKPESVLACILFGHELGIGPMQALTSIHVIDGRPSAAPELMRALVAGHGHRIDVITLTDQTATLKGQRTDTGASAEITWTMTDAERAGLAGRGSWAKYPRAMLLARATSELCRALFPDVIAGLSYTPEEVRSLAVVDPVDVDDPNVVESVPLEVVEAVVAVEPDWVELGYTGREEHDTRFDEVRDQAAMLGDDARQEIREMFRAAPKPIPAPVMADLEELVAAYLTALAPADEWDTTEPAEMLP